MEYNRYAAELSVLQQRLPSSSYRFFGIGSPSPYLRVGARTNSGNVYTLHIDLSDFPMGVPKVFVTKMLKSKTGSDMDDASGAMHTLPSEHGWTRICHYGYGSWTPGVSL